MSWIKTIGYEEAGPALKKIYSQVAGPNGRVDNVLKIHGLRPHTLRGHMGLYKSVLHHKNNSLPLWYLEALGVYVSQMNKCSYCVDHHLMGIKRILSVDAGNRLMRSIDDECLEDYFKPERDFGSELRTKANTKDSRT